MTTARAEFIAVTFGQRASDLGAALEALGTSVVQTTQASSVLETLDTLSDVSALVLSSDVGREQAAAVFTAAKGRYASLPTIWLGDQLAGAPLADFRSSPDALLHDPVSAETVQRSLRELLQRLHPDTIAGLLVSVVGQALQDSCSTVATASRVRVNAIHRLVNEVNTIVAFCGAGVSGKLLVSASEATLFQLYQRAVPDRTKPGKHEAEDLAGEIANLAAGKLKFAFDQLGVVCEIGTPLLVGRAGVILRPSRGQPSLCVEFTCEQGTVRGELTIDNCDDTQLARLSCEVVPDGPGESAEVNFF